MLANYSELRLGIIFSVILLMVGSVSAAGEPVLDVEKADKVVWMNEQSEDTTLNVTSYCEPENKSKSITSIEELYIWSGGQNEHDFIQNSNPELENQSKFKVDLSSSSLELETGEHTIVAACDGSQKTDTFDTDKLHLQIEKPSDQVFLNENFQVDVKVTSEAGNLRLKNMDYPNLELESDTTSFESFNSNNGVKKETTTLESNRKIPIDFIEKGEDTEEGAIRVSTKYNEENNEGLPIQIPLEDTVKTEINRWNIKTVFSPSKRISFRDLSDMNASSSIRYEGQAVKPDTPEDTDYAGRFYLDDEGDKIEPDKGDDGSYEWFSGGYKGTSDTGFGLYELKLQKTPKLKKGTHELDVYFDAPFGGDKKIGSFTVENKFTFEGRVSDSDSRAVNTDFTLDSGDFVEKFSTRMNGEFSRKILPKEYGFDVEFPKGSITLSETVLKEDYTGNINYDYFKNPGSMGLDIGGIKPINLMTVSFGYPFKDARAQMQYNPAKVENPMNVHVFECVEWNFWSKECISGWDKIDDEAVTLPPTEWTAKFPVTPVETEEYGDKKNVMLSAYMVGTRSGLRVSQISLDNYRVSKGSNYGISGKVVSSNGNVENADVTFSLMEDGEFVWNASGQTDINGDFQISMEAPEEGNYSIHVAAEKEPYDPYSERIDETVWVYKNSEISVELPTQIDITPGETTETDITLSNDGQTTYSDIELGVEGPENVEVSLSDSTITTLEPGNSETITASITLAEDFCNPSCSQYPTFEISLNAMTDGKEVEETYDLNSIVKRTQSSSSSDSDDDSETSQTSETSTEDENNGGLTGAFSGLEETPTGEFLASQSSLNIALGLIMVFTMALAGAIKKKKDGSSSGRGSRNMSRGPRNGRNGGRQVNIQRPKVSPSEEPEVMSPDDDIDEIAEAMSEKDQQAVVEEDVDEVEISHEEPKVETPEEVEDTDEEDKNTDEESDGEFKCDTCGENFDTKSGLKLHREALH